MQRVFLSNDEFLNKQLLGENLYHQKVVLRIKEQDQFEAVFSNRLFICAVTHVSNEYINFDIVEEKELKDNNIKITLVQGIAKGDKNEDIIKHGTELGVSEIIFANMDFSIAKIVEKNIENKLDRYNKIALNAANQSHRNSIPNIAIKDLNKIDYSSYDICILLDEEEAKKEEPYYINSVDLHEKKNILFVIGPEGGISPKERNYLIQNGFIPVALTKNILRTETASLAMLSILDYKLRGE